ncbi:efflux transporter outer membrane subunit [Dyadobacter sp. 32]|uniref:efflux transporter outer membrane subunit n=1 Tax=Dyadobacter sp. 32 TaxID=538966 RepID=UPI0011ED4D26
MKIKFFLLILVLIISACRVGKDYQRPQLGLPDQFGTTHSTDTTLSQVPDVKSFFKDVNLQALIDTAILQNNDLGIAVKNIESAQAVLKKVRLNYLPDLNAQITANQNISSANSLAGIGNEQFIGSRSVKDFSASLGLSWEIDIWGRIRREKQEALAMLLQMQEVRRAVQTQLVADVANGYYNLLMLDRQLEIAVQSRQLSDSTLAVTNAQYKVGEANLLSIRQAGAQLELTAQLTAQIEQSIKVQENALSLLCGKYAQHITRQPIQQEDILDISDAAYNVSMLAVRPDVHAAELALVAANARVGIAQAQMYPALSITASGGLNSFKASNWLSVPGALFGSVAGGLTQPVFQRRSLKTRYEQAVIEREKAVLSFRQAVLQGYTEVSDALVINQSLDEQFLAAERRQQALQEGVGTAAVLFRTGMVNYLEVLTVENTYLQTRLNLAELQREKAGAIIGLYRSLGGGWK